MPTQAFHRRRQQTSNHRRLHGESVTENDFIPRDISCTVNGDLDGNLNPEDDDALDRVSNMIESENSASGKFYTI